VKYVRINNTKQDRYPARRLDTNRVNRDLGFATKMDFIEGLKRAIMWYKNKCGVI
jgi:nucleoside-diphosphate-sugar epimerase